MLDSDVLNADERLHVEFFIAKDIEGWDGKPFVRIMIPGDKNTIIEQPVKEDHKKRFPRQWLYFQMSQENPDAPEVGTTIESWHLDAKDEIGKAQVEELRILKFRTVEQIAAASDNQLQRIGMGGVSLREKAKAYLVRKNRSETQKELDDTKQQLAQLQAQMAELIAVRKPGRPPKPAEGE